MIKVQAFGDMIQIPNPARPGEVTTMQNVVFIEEGRDGANKALSQGSDLLSQALGVEAGLVQVRTHTQPVALDAVAKLQVGMEIPNLHINRELYSSPQIRNQVDKEARMIDGQPTYFTTYISDRIEADRDRRIGLDVLATIRPNEIFNAQIGATEIVRSRADGSESRRVGVNEATLPGGNTVASAAEGNPLGANPNILANANRGEQLVGAPVGADQSAGDVVRGNSGNAGTSQAGQGAGA
jgi:hypothetical protein